MGRKKYFFFGDMMELGSKSHIYHKKLQILLIKVILIKLMFMEKGRLKHINLSRKIKEVNLLIILRNSIK